MTTKRKAIRMAKPELFPPRKNNLSIVVCSVRIHSALSLPLLGMLFFGNLLKEKTLLQTPCRKCTRSIIDIASFSLASPWRITQADVFLNERSVKIFILGLISFIIATFAGVLFVKIMNLFCKEGNKINPLIGNAGVSAVPDSARVSEVVGLEADPGNHLLMHAMGPNVAGVIGSAVAAGILLCFLG